MPQTNLIRIGNRTASCVSILILSVNYFLMDVIEVYVNSYLVCTVNIFVFTAGFDYYQKWSSSPHSDACEKGISPSPDASGTMRSTLSRVLRSLCPIIFLLVTLIFSAGPLFGPLAGLPLRQRWGWLHQCDPYPIELILYGQANSSIPSTISFYMTPSRTQTNPGPPQRQHAFDFIFVTDISGLKVLRYRPIDNTALSHEHEPSIKTMFHDTSQRRFFGCSSADVSFENATRCLDAIGSYNQDQYLSFSITTIDPPSTTFLRLLHKEYAFSNDAPNFDLRFADENGVTGRCVLTSALTKPNDPSTLKACGIHVSSNAIFLGPLLLFMDEVNKFSRFIQRPRVFQLD